jgi:hypothetical protein
MGFFLAFFQTKNKASSADLDNYINDTSNSHLMHQITAWLMFGCVQLCQTQPGFNHGIRIKRQAINALLH